MHWSALKRHVADAVREQPDIASKMRRGQWTALIAKPLQQIEPGDQGAVIVIVVDALDECENDQDISGLITLLSGVKDITNIRLRIIVTSRPQTPIRLAFRKIPGILHRDLLLHNFEDVKLAQEWLPVYWPTIDSVNQLVRISEGLFIFAATVCLFVADEPHTEDALELFI
ncbi:hypothetical protein LTR49_027387 [Elasticomyces elasticus]|nr:hypothetical protein LTR49_027387 [Elasticomyces elasticus]